MLIYVYGSFVPRETKNLSLFSFRVDVDAQELADHFDGRTLAHTLIPCPITQDEFIGGLMKRIVVDHAQVPYAEKFNKEVDDMLYGRPLEQGSALWNWFTPEERILWNVRQHELATGTALRSSFRSLNG